MTRVLLKCALVKFSLTFFIQKNKPRPIKSEHGKELQGAGGSSLGLQGIFLIPLKILNRTISHEVCVCKNVSDRILGIDFFQKHNLQYDTRRRKVYFDKPKPESVVSVSSETHFPAQGTKVINTTFHGDLNDNARYITTVFSPDSSLLMGGPAMVTINSDLKCAIAITNTAPFDIYLQRGAIIGLIEMEDISDKIVPLTSDNVKSIIQAIAPKQEKSENLTCANIEKKQT